MNEIGKCSNDKKKGRYKAYEDHEIDYILRNLHRHPSDVAKDIKRPTESVRAKMAEIRRGEEHQKRMSLHRLAVGLKQ